MVYRDIYMHNWGVCVCVRDLRVEATKFFKIYMLIYLHLCNFITSKAVHSTKTETSFWYPVEWIVMYLKPSKSQNTLVFSLTN